MWSEKIIRLRLPAFGHNLQLCNEAMLMGKLKCLERLKARAVWANNLAGKTACPNMDGHKRRVVQHFGLVVSQKPDLCRENLQIQCNPACSRKCLLSQTPTQEILKRKNPNSWITKHLFPLVSAWMGHALVTILPLKVLQDGQELKPLLQFLIRHWNSASKLRLLMWPFLDFAHDRWIPKGWFGYGSIPINTIFNGMNIHWQAILMFTRGTRFWHTAKSDIVQATDSDL